MGEAVSPASAKSIQTVIASATRTVTGSADHSTAMALLIAAVIAASGQSDDPECSTQSMRVGRRGDGRVLSARKLDCLNATPLLTGQYAFTPTPPLSISSSALSDVNITRVSCHPQVRAAVDRRGDGTIIGTLSLLPSRPPPSPFLPIDATSYGAGNSTLIKLLTGETEAQIGTVFKLLSLRIGYVLQHATHHIESHLDKTPFLYIQWRFQDGRDREILEKATRTLTDEEKAVLNQDFIGKDCQRRKLELIIGRQKLKKSLRYEVKWQGLDHKFNTWIPRDELLEMGFQKIVSQFDDQEASRRWTARHLRSHRSEANGDIANPESKKKNTKKKNGDIAQYNEIVGLSGGQKIKLVIAACL